MLRRKKEEVEELESLLSIIENKDRPEETNYQSKPIPMLDEFSKEMTDLFETMSTSK